MTPEERLEQVNKLTNSAKDRLDIEESIRGILDEQNKSISSFFSTQNKIAENKRQQKAVDSTITKLAAEYAEIAKTASADQAEKLKSKIQELEVMKKLSNTIREETVVLEKNRNFVEAIARSAGDAVSGFLKSKFELKDMWNYLQDIDGAIRKYQLSLGAAGEKADMIRKQTENSVNASARFGAGIKDIIELQSGLNDLTGKSNVFRGKEILDLVAITKGTGLQNEEVSKLVGNMMLFGSSIGDAKDLVQKTVNDTSKMGLNSSKVMKSLAANIDKMDNYRFQNGVEGLKKMVMSSEKFRFSIEGALAAADKFRTLEGLLEAGATMRVLGGEFAKMDEFKLSFLARNKPEEFAVEMAKLTKGMASFNKETGTFDISDVDYDKLRVIAEATGREVGDLTKQARQFNQLEFAKKQIFAGTDEEKEMIAKLATFQKGSTIGTIQIGDKNVRLDQLTDKQISLYTQQQKTLEERAKDSQNFNESFENTITQLKSTLLPLLTYINKGLEKFNGMIDGFRDSTGALSGWAAAIPIGGLLLGIGGGAIIMGLTKGLFSLIGSGIGKMFGGMGTTLGEGGVGVLSASLGTLAGIGIAAVGVGAGMYLAAKGVAALAEAFSKLSTGQMVGVGVSLGILGASMLGIVALAPALGAAAIPLLEFGAAVALIGAGVGIAAAGIAEIVKAFNNSTENINFTGLEALGGVDFDNMDKLNVLKSFKESDVERMQEMFDVLNQINSIDTSKLDQLQKLFTNSTLKVQLEGNPMINNHITVEVDGEKFYKKVEKMIPIVVRRGAMPK